VAVQTAVRIGMASNAADRHPSCAALLVAAGAAVRAAGITSEPRPEAAGVPSGGLLGRWLRRSDGGEPRLW
jgi:hypothetical protein